MFWRNTLVFCLLVLARECHSKKRDKRYIFVNPDAPITLGFILNMPLSLALPSLAFQPRSLSDNSIDHQNDVPESLDIDPNYVEPLEQLQSYFAFLEIESLACQERLICELGSHPEAYYPVTELVMKQIRVKNGKIDKSDNSLIWRYKKAAREGFLASDKECGRLYAKCPYPAHKLINMSVIKVWQYLESKLNLKLV